VGDELFERYHLAFLGSLRVDGSPRVSPVEPYLGSGELVLGVMTGSAKARDLMRDPRCSLHTIVVDPDAGEPEVTVRGRFIDIDPSVRDGDPDAWWLTSVDKLSLVGTIEIASATLLRWDLTAGRLSITSWTPERGLTERTRAYP